MAAPTLNISSKKVSYIIMMAHEFDAKEADSDPDEGSNASDDKMIDVLEDNGEDATQSELTGFISELNEDEQVDLVALAWLGRDEDTTLDDWSELHAEARRAHNKRTAAYLLGMPLLGDYLANGLEQFGITFEEIEREEF